MARSSPALAGALWHAVTRPTLPELTNYDHRYLSNLEPILRINRLALGHDLEMQVAAGGIAGGAEVGDLLPLGDLLALPHVFGLEVVVGGLHTGTVVQHNAVAVAVGAGGCLDHRAGFGGRDGSAARLGEVQAVVELAGSAGDRVDPVAEA